MAKHNARNERIKRRYFDYLKEAKRMDVSSVDMAAAAIASFEHWGRYREFAAFHIEQAKAYKAYLANLKNGKTGKPLAKSTINSRLMALKAFFFWLAGQPGYKSRIAFADADYFNLSANDARVATARRETRAPNIEQVQHVLSRMPSQSDTEKRDRAIIAFTLLTGARDNAIASFKLRHIDISERRLFQDARDVRTKNRKTFTTFFFPVGDETEAIICDWMRHLREELRFGPDDPLFPKTLIALGNDGLFGASSLSREHWSNAAAIRRIFKQAFEWAGLPYANPHSLRKTLAILGETLCHSPEEFKAWSQNLGHEQVLTTFLNYGTVAGKRQAEIFNRLSHGKDKVSDSETEDRIAKAVAVLTGKAD